LVDMKEYRSALDSLKKGTDGYGSTIWIEGMGTDGRLMKHAGGLYGYIITPAEYSRFGESTQIEVEKRRPKYDDLR
jgi:hypothetical protein